jgi:hypothetical protein
MDDIVKNIRVNMQHFGNIPVIDKVTQNPILNKYMQPVMRCGIITTSMTVAQVAEHFRGLVLEVMPAHQFRALHQHEQFKKMKDPRTLPLDHCTVVMDFSQNAQLLYGNEVQAAHWSIQQVSLHIAVVYRHATTKCGDGVDSTIENPVVVKDIFSFVSDDFKHDTHFVHECQRYIYVEHYQGKHGVKFAKSNEWTDGCASQYKCSNAFGDLGANWERDFGFPVVRHFFETSHAKGEQDGEGGTLKKAAAEAVRVDKHRIIQNSKQWVEYLNEWSATRAPDPRREYKNRYIIEIDAEALAAYRLQRIPSTRFDIAKRPGETAVGVQGWHTVRAHPNDPARIFARELSCACIPCMTGVWGLCKNPVLAGAWEERIVCQLKADEKRVTRAMTAQINLADCMPETMAFIGSFMAYNRPDGRPGQDLSYGLIRLTADLHQLVERLPVEGISDSYGNVMLPGQRYVEGVLFHPIGDGVETETEFLSAPKGKARKATARKQQPDRPLRWLQADISGKKKMFIEVEALLKAQVTINVQVEGPRAAQVTSIGKALYLRRCGDVYKGDLKEVDDVLPPSEKLSEDLIKHIITKQCLVCDKKMPTKCTTPQCNACLRTHCYGCTPFAGKEPLSKKEYASLDTYYCAECTTDKLDIGSSSHDDAVLVQWTSRKWHSMDRIMHDRIMAAKDIPRPDDDYEYDDGGEQSESASESASDCDSEREYGDDDDI